jgi:hypothetical protein
MILDALKKRLYKANDKHPGRWLKELPTVVWGLRTQPSRNTGVSPYFMVFGSEAVLPADIAFQLPWVENHDEEKSSEARELEVNYAEEHHLDSCAHTAKYLEGLRGTITVMSRIESSRLVIWFCKGSRRQKDCIS